MGTIDEFLTKIKEKCTKYNQIPQCNSYEALPVSTTFQTLIGQDPDRESAGWSLPSLSGISDYVFGANRWVKYGFGGALLAGGVYGMHNLWKRGTCGKSGFLADENKDNIPDVLQPGTIKEWRKRNGNRLGLNRSSASGTG